MGNEISPVVGEGNTSQDGTNTVAGQAHISSAPQADVGEPQGIAQDQPTQVQPDGGDTSVEQTPEERYSALETKFNNLERDNKSLQTEFGKRNESSKELDAKFSQYGGVDQVLQWTQALAGNQEFGKWVQQQQQAQMIGGQDVSQMDDESKKALDMVQNIATQTAQNLIDKAMQQQVDPLANSYKEQIMTSNFAKMDEKYGKVMLGQKEISWQEYREQMSTLAKDLPNGDNPSFEDIEDLFFKVLRADNQMGNYGASIYQQELQTKKQQASQAPPTSSGQGDLPPANSLAEALNRAKTTHGVSGEVKF